MDMVKAELARNMTGYFLVITGLITVAAASHFHYDKMIDMGDALVTAALLAFQAKRTPDGNTTTTQVTVPPPEVAAPVVPKLA